MVKADRTTTKTRVVFDASASCGGVSLNDMIHQGPKLQRELFEMYLRMKLFQINLVTDFVM